MAAAAAAAAAAADAPQPTAEVRGALLAMAARLAAQGAPLQAAKCYTAVLGLSLLPADEAVAHLRLGQLLLEHTHNIAEAKQHLQKAEMLAAPLPGQQHLKCEVLSQLGRIHGALGEGAFQRQSYAKGLELCQGSGGAQGGGGAGSRRALAEWGVYFRAHTACSLALDQEPARAAEEAQAGAALAEEHSLLDQQLLCLLFQLQLAMMSWDRQRVDGLLTSVAEALAQLEQQGGGAAGAPGMLAPLKLHATLLQVVAAVHLGNFQDLCPPSAPSGQPPLLAELEAQLERLPPGAAEAYSWLPRGALAGLVQLLAATVLKPIGKVKQAMVHISRGLQHVDGQLASLRVDPGACEQPLDRTAAPGVRACLALRLLLLELRQQLHLLSSDFAAAGQDLAEAVQLVSRFPVLLASLAPAVHLQAGLYAQALGAHDRARQHFTKASASRDGQLALCARCMAALCCLAMDAPEGGVALGRELLGELSGGVDSGLGYAERAAAHVAGGLLELASPEASSEDKADAKQRLSKALKLAHGRLQNHQLVSQVLLFMTPLQVTSSDIQGALQMVTSSFTLAKGAGDLYAQLSGLTMMQQLYHHRRQPQEAAKNANYIARKQDDLAARVQEAEAARHHAALLQWDLQ